MPTVSLALISRVVLANKDSLLVCVLSAVVDDCPGCEEPSAVGGDRSILRVFTGSHRYISSVIVTRSFTRQTCNPQYIHQSP